MLRLRDDKDPVRALGFVTLHTGYLEDELAQLVDLVRDATPMHENVQSFRLADQARHAKRAFSGLFANTRDYPGKQADRERVHGFLKPSKT
jgi:hypothetical protein